MYDEIPQGVIQGGWPFVIAAYAFTWVGHQRLHRQPVLSGPRRPGPSPRELGMNETTQAAITEERGNKRILAIIALAIVGSALSLIAWGGIGENLVYYWSPQELHEAGDKAVGASIRLGGLVEAGSLELNNDGSLERFTIVDGDHSVEVKADGLPPAMFREGIGVLVEGTMHNDGYFHSDLLMVKHDNIYQAPGRRQSPRRQGPGQVHEARRQLSLRAPPGPPIVWRFPLVPTRPLPRSSRPVVLYRRRAPGFLGRLSPQ